MKITNKKYYFLSLFAVLLLSIYPLIMGVRVLSIYFRHGHIVETDYPKYLIPYTPIAFALILSVLLLPAFVKIFKRFALCAVSVFGVGMFLVYEGVFESIAVFSLKDGNMDIGSWQSTLCIVTPEVARTLQFKKTIGAELAMRYSPVFKVHFYLIAILIVLAVIGIVYGFGKMIRENNFDKKRPLILQSAATCAFIGLCILACFTSFYRTGEINLTLISSGLMSLFFIIFGLVAGLYVGGILYFKKPLISRLIPSFAAALTTLVMYIGELVLMGGVLFKFGSGFLFEPLGICPFAPIDILVILLSGAITYLILYMIKQKRSGD